MAKTNYLLVFSLMMLLVGLGIFFNGYHFLDICKNENNLMHEINRLFCEAGLSDSYSVRERTVEGKELSECYRDGLRSVWYSTWIIVIGGIVFGYSFAELSKRGKK